MRELPSRQHLASISAQHARSACKPRATLPVLTGRSTSSGSVCATDSSLWSRELSQVSRGGPPAVRPTAGSAIPPPFPAARGELQMQVLLCRSDRRQTGARCVLCLPRSALPPSTLAQGHRVHSSVPLLRWRHFTPLPRDEHLAT